jgi:cytochrome bd-type quinol oxidase subunit 2
VPSAGISKLQIELRSARCRVHPYVQVELASRRSSSSKGVEPPSLQGVSLTRFLQGYREDWGQLEEHREMWSYVQMSYPLLTIALAAAMCLVVASFIMGQAKPHR